MKTRLAETSFLLDFSANKKITFKVKGDIFSVLSLVLKWHLSQIKFHYSFLAKNVSLVVESHNRPQKLDREREEI